MKRRDIGAHIGFLIVYVFWGINVSSMKIGGHDWDAVVFNGLRYLSISPFLWLYAILYLRRQKLPVRMAGADLLRICVLGVLSAFGLEVMLSYALQYSNSANGAVLGRGLMPVMTVIFSLLLREIRLTPRILVGLPLAMAGVVILTAAGPSGFHIGRDTLRGDGLLLLRSVFGAIYLIGMSRLVRRYPLPLLLALEMTSGAVSLLPFVLIRTNEAFFQAMPLEGWFSLGYTAIFATLIGFPIHNWSLGRLGPLKASVYGYFSPVFAAAGGWVLLGETLRPLQVAGAVAILAAMWLVQRDRFLAAAGQPERREKPVPSVPAD